MTHSAITPSTTAGAPSRRNSHCHPASPARWCSERIASDTGAPTMIAIGAAIMKRAPVRARSAAGIQ